MASNQDLGSRWPEGEVYLPTRYFTPAEGVDESLLLGRAIDWQGDDIGFVRGIGLKTFLVGDDDLTIMQWESLSFEPSGVPAEPVESDT